MKYIVFDIFSVLLECDYKKALLPYFSEKTINNICSTIFFHSDWRKVDSGLQIEKEAIKSFAKRLDLCTQEIEFILSIVRDSIAPISIGVELLYWVKEMNFDVYCLSNMPPKTYEIVNDKYNFFRIFSGTVISGLVKLAKPDQRIYQYFLKKFHLNPLEAFFIDDQLENIISAKEVGMEAHQFDMSTQTIANIKQIINMDKLF